MKKLNLKTVLVVSLIILLCTTGCDGLKPDIQNNSLMEPDHEYEIDTWGSNSEMYEFTPKSHPGYTCVFLMLDSGAAMGLQCFPKPEAK